MINARVVAVKNLKSVTGNKMLEKFTTKKGRVVEIVEPSLDYLSMYQMFYKRLTAEDAMINRYENLDIDTEKRKLENKIAEIKANNAVAVAAIFDNQIVGTCNISRIGGRGWHVGNLGVMVDKDFRREGIGRFLMEFVLEKIKNMKIKIVTLDSFVINEPAIALYQKLGFQEYGRLPNAFLWRGKYYDEMKMYLEL